MAPYDTRFLAVVSGPYTSHYRQWKNDTIREGTDALFVLDD